MSMGYGARATLVLEDAETAIYTYGGFNWDIPSCKNPDYVQDGLLTIPRDCLPEPEIHARWRRMPSGKKRWIEKRVPVTVDVCGMIREGRIVVEDCSYCWVRLEEAGGVDTMACRVLRKIFEKYQEAGALPKEVFMLS